MSDEDQFTSENDQFTEVEHVSWFGRIGGAFKGIVVGLIMFAGALPLLFWNEGRSVKEYKTLQEGGGAVVSVASDRVDPTKAGLLIHVTGKADSEASLKDPVFGVSANALKLKRSVEMYQWHEKSQSKTEKELGGGTKTVTTYTYNQEWSDKLIHSSDFKHPNGHQNPRSLPYESTQMVADKVTLGAFTLSPSLVGMINNYEPLPVSDDTPLPANLVNKAKLHDGGFYFGNDPVKPQVGNVRIKFFVAKPTEVSIVAKQIETTFEPYFAKTGGSIELLQTGSVSAQGMIQKAQEDNILLTWILRLAGFVLLLIGINLILRPLSVFADVLPLLGNIVGAGTGFISFLLAALVTCIVIAVAWLAYRPLLSGGLIAAALALAVAFKMKLKPAAIPPKIIPQPPPIPKS